MRLGFFGLPLGALLLSSDGHEIELAVLSPVEAPGRRRLGRVARRVLDADDDIDQALGALEPELIVSWYWTRLLPERWLARARLGGIGVHPSLLPRHRGPNPFFWAIDSGDTHTGVTVHRLTPRYDDGAILSRASVEIGQRDSWQLARALDRPSLRELRDVTQRLDRERVLEEPQSELASTWAPEPTGELLRVDFRWPTERALRRIRALSPIPGLALEVDGMRLFVTRAGPARDFPAALEPGEAAIVAGEVVIRTGDGAITLHAASEDGGDPVDLGKLAERIASHYRPV